MIQPELLRQLVKRHPYNIHGIPRNKRGGAVLPQHESHDILGIHAALVAQHLVEARRVQQRPCAEDFARRILVLLLEIIRQDIQRIGDDDQNCLPRIPRDLLHHAVHHLDVLPQKRVPVMIARQNRRPRGHDNDVRIAQVLVVTHPDARVGTVGERRRVACIKNLPERLVPVAVDHHNVIDNIHPQDRIQYRGAHLPGSDDCQLAVGNGHDKPRLPLLCFLYAVCSLYAASGVCMTCSDKILLSRRSR